MIFSVRLALVFVFVCNTATHAMDRRETGGSWLRVAERWYRDTCVRAARVKTKLDCRLSRALQPIMYPVRLISNEWGELPIYQQELLVTCLFNVGLRYFLYLESHGETSTFSFVHHPLILMYAAAPSLTKFIGQYDWGRPYISRHVDPANQCYAEQTYVGNFLTLVNK